MINLEFERRFRDLFFDKKFQCFILEIVNYFSKKDLTINLFSINYTKTDIDCFKIYFGFNRYIDDFLEKIKDRDIAWKKITELYFQYKNLIDLNDSRALALAYKKHPVENFDTLYLHIKFNKPGIISSEFLVGDQIKSGISFEINTTTGEVVEKKKYFYLKTLDEKQQLYKKFKDEKILSTHNIEYTMFYKGDNLISEKYNFIHELKCGDVIQANADRFKEYPFAMEFNKWLCDEFNIICRTFGEYKNDMEKIALYYYPSDYHIDYPKYIDVVSVIMGQLVNKIQKKSDRL